VTRLVVVVSLLAGAGLAAARQEAPLKPQHVMRGNALRVEWPQLAAIAVQRDFVYAGSQRFILKGVADAEQHAFGEADRRGQVTRFYWFQFESLLPAAKGAYDYSKDTPLKYAGLDWRVDVRRYTAPPEADGDQAALYKLFSARGWRPPLPALRVRLVYVPPDDPRRELMVIYAEATSASDPPTAKETAGIITRAQAGLRFLR
jgi:hypothetical protein